MKSKKQSEYELHENGEVNIGYSMTQQFWEEVSNHSIVDKLVQHKNIENVKIDRM